MESIWEYRYLLLSGTVVTVQLAVGSLILSVVLGLAGASAKLARNPISNRFASAYTTLVRGVPDLSLIQISEPTRRRGIGEAGVCMKKK